MVSSESPEWTNFGHYSLLITVFTGFLHYQLKQEINELS